MVLTSSQWFQLLCKSFLSFSCAIVKLNILWEQQNSSCWALGNYNWHFNGLKNSANKSVEILFFILLLYYLSFSNSKWVHLHVWVKWASVQCITHVKQLFKPAGCCSVTLFFKHCCEMIKLTVNWDIFPFPEAYMP